MLFYLTFGCFLVAASEKYIVVLKPNITSQMAEAHLSDVRMHSLVPNNRTSRIGNLHFYSAHLSETGIDEIQKNQSHVIDYLIKDQTFRAQELIQTNPPNWGLPRIDSHTDENSLFSFPTSAGSGVDVYVLDTGVYAHHNDLVSRVTSAPSFIGEATDTTDSNGHGTFVAGVCCGLTYGVAKKSNIISVKALTSDGEGTLANVLLALEWVVQRHQSKPNARSIVNLSLSGNYSKTANDAIQEAIDAGIHFSIAAGNDGVNACSFSPASSPNAMTVGASNKNDTVATYSNYGACVDLYAPGTHIVSAGINGATDTNTLSGTSVASPFVAGVMALYLGEKNYTPAELRAILLNSSTPIATEDESVTIQQFDNLDTSSNFHLLYSGNWSTDGIQKVFEIASSANSSLFGASKRVAAIVAAMLTTYALISC
ncbi:hypothetical protein INT44_001318 [Umbelopsis vinacea]|uniref:Peptidase S8/S53 domain-containing protein n=1 Tax=Umbelopsis vinacea TaxID=44442 RepID=A0A8H7QBC7_9FUNG|nr:hypothetical protein INT44_001318 [Umbelopsis vinacea]